VSGFSLVELEVRENHRYEIKKKAGGCKIIDLDQDLLDDRARVGQPITLNHIVNIGRNNFLYAASKLEIFKRCSATYNSYLPITNCKNFVIRSLQDLGADKTNWDYRYAIRGRIFKCAELIPGSRVRVDGQTEVFIVLQSNIKNVIVVDEKHAITLTNIITESSVCGRVIVWRFGK